MPWCLQAVLEYVEQDFGNPPIYIYENGLCLFLTRSLLSSCSFIILFLCFSSFSFPGLFFWKWTLGGNPMGQQENFAS